MEDVKASLFDIGDDKSIRPGGYTSKLFNQAWNIMGGSFYEVILEFISSREVLKQTIHAIVAMLPKMEHFSTMGDFQAISCCNVFYKVITKLMASILGEILSTI